MEFREKEVQAVADAIAVNDIAQLEDLQLALVGGGIGETSL